MVAGNSTQSGSATSSDPYGISRSVKPVGVLPQQAEVVSPALPIRAGELLIEVESLNIDSASFHQISEACGGDPAKIEKHVVELVRARGKHHNPVTGSGGMLIGRVAEIGSEFPVAEKPVKVGDRIATLVSLTLTPLEIRRVKKVHPQIDRVDIEGHAVLFSTGLFAKLPGGELSDAVALAVLDVAGAPAQTRKLVKDGDLVVVIGGGGKSGLLCLYETKRARPRAVTVAVEYSEEACARLRGFGFVDHVVRADARRAVDVMSAVLAVTGGRRADVVINVANVPETELSSILCARDGGIVYLFSMATSFTRAALGAEGVGADVDLRIGNGYTRGHADLALGLLRESPVLKRVFEERFV